MFQTLVGELGISLYDNFLDVILINLTKFMNGRKLYNLFLLGV